MNIKKKQNTKLYLSLQYSARHAYNVAETLGVLSWLLTLALIIVGWFDEGKHPALIAYYTAIITITGAVFDYFKTKLINLAAGIRTYIDYQLFNFEHKSVYNGYDESDLLSYRDLVIKLHKKTYEKQISHSGTEKYKGVMDWYILEDNMVFHEEIITAQKENCSFDEKIINYCYAFYIFVFAVLAICVVKFDNRLLLICAFIPAFLKAIKDIISYRECKKIHTEEKGLILKLDDGGYDKKTSFLLQECIDERRKLDLITHSLFYKINTVRLHKKYDKKL